jgi:hypothetical protein
MFRAKVALGMGCAVACVSVLMFEWFWPCYIGDASDVSCQGAPESGPGVECMDPSFTGVVCMC